MNVCVRERRWVRLLAGICLVLALGSGWAVRAGSPTGEGMKDFDEVFSLDPDRAITDVALVILDTGKPLGVFYPGEQPTFTFQLQNRTNKPIRVTGKFDVYHYGAKGIPGDVWKPQVVKFGELGSIPVEVDLAPNGWQNITISPPLPETMGGYGLVLDLGEYGRSFAMGYARAHQPTTKRLQFPKQSLDGMDPIYLERLGCQAIRFGWSYYHSEHPQYEDHMKNLEEKMKDMQEHRVTAVMEFGGGKYPPVMEGQGGSWRTHLDEEGNQIGGKPDLAWLPEFDDDFEEFVYGIACEYGWPKGPITGFMLWNEPWEGKSISGWQADMPRYRSIYMRIGKAVDRARKDANVDVLIGGCDSSSNTWDKLLGEGPENSPFWPEYLDFCSIHYQGMSSPSLYRAWNERKHYKGRVLIWDTESWVANTDDRIGGLIASNRAAGYDRSLGVFYGYLCTAMSHGRKHYAKVYHEDGTVENKFPQPEYAWPAAAAFLAAQEYIGERDFREIVFQKGLPWVYTFDGLEGNPDDGTVVIVGDVGNLFNRPEIMLYRTVRSQKENDPALRQEAADLETAIAETSDRAKRSALQARLKALNSRQDAWMEIPATDPAFHLFDMYGNEVKTEGDVIRVPLDIRGTYLRADPDEKGSFARLVEAVRKGRIVGLEPVELIPHDMLAPIETKPVLRVTVHNILNRPVEGTLALTMDGLTLEYETALALAPFETKTVEAHIVDGAARPDNTYPLTLSFDAGADGISKHEDGMRVNLIHRRTITVDGKLDDWKGALPQIIKTDEAASRTFTEEAWLPMEDLEAGAAGGFAVGFLAYDDDYFYFAAKVADDTPHAGTYRHETLDDSVFYYPEVAYHTKTDQYGMPIERNELHWPEGVRRFSYRKHPTLPSGGQGEPFDNIQIGFNAIPFAEEADWITNLPGRPPKFTMYKCMDHEYALNMVAPEWGGGFEVWRLQVPGMSRKHFYPRQPEHPLEGAVKEAKLMTVYGEGARYTEVAIPWSELPAVKKLLDAGKPVKFSYRVNHDTRGPTMELARGRSVSRFNSRAFHVDWNEHWANELEFAFEGK